MKLVSMFLGRVATPLSSECAILGRSFLAEGTSDFRLKIYGETLIEPSLKGPVLPIPIDGISAAA